MSIWEKETFEIEVERKKILISHINTKVLKDNIGYIYISDFDGGCADEFTQKYKELKKYWKLLSKNPLELSAKQKKRLEKLRKLNKEFSENYGYKIRFYELLKVSKLEEFKVGLEELIEALSKSGIKECMYLSKTYRNWYLEIVNSFESKIDNGFVEGYNNK